MAPKRGSGMAIPWEALRIIGLFGGLGGAVNALLCYVNWPRMGGGTLAPFTWHIVPAGALHGALLAIVAVGLSERLLREAWPKALAGLVVAGWVAGWLSFIPLQWYIGSINFGLGLSAESPGLPPKEILLSLVWPVDRAAWERFWHPYAYFGLVASAFAAGRLATSRLARANDRVTLMAVGMAAGVLGSLWWWVMFERWIFSLLHGAIWGALVGYGAWKARSLSAR